VVFSAWQIAAAEPAVSWPQRPVTFIVPFVAGGTSDMFARLLAPELSAVIGQPVIIDNVAGAGGAIGARKLSTAVPDGHVLMYGGISETVLIPQSNTMIGYQPQNLHALSILASTPLVLAVRKNFPARDLDTLWEMARSSPMKYTYGSAGISSYGHLVFEALARKQGIQLLHVPYKGSSQMLTEMASGQIDLALTSLPSVVPYVKANVIDLLAISTPQRSTEWPKLPIFSESVAWAQVPMSTWLGVFSPPGLPPEVSLNINATFSKVLKNEALRAKLTQLGIQLEKSRSPVESQIFYEHQVRQYRALTTTP
jgi:tripartite-type tricarboxylate transporter receptor subunit TctC